ncbi:hypothetical protein J2T10_002643 [Paenarthrobacter nicotinovorans]|uniref:Uncharacterized protein n=1 Tax=Paenarthrobacter nicotinovorans TaxID=29320 RepID=A0ABT9TPI4_PAENI|nr:hypothetical protein [Paenarthrobacter nicotinovorans]MDQ0102986.1 hypothetical protein [Paenarthrobacter nicotinovorans]
MTAARLKLALEQIQPSDWRLFESFAAEFLVVDYPMLRTTASPSGDGGRDGELFVPDGMPEIGFQYSVTKDWSTKIKQTRSRLKDTFPGIKRIIYVTNQVIGAGADQLKRELWDEYGVLVDVLDQSYFLERELTNPQRSAASDELSAKLVDPFLASRGVVANVGQALSHDEGRLALLHLTLDRTDGANGRSLTKSCFDSLVLSVLHDTTAENMKTMAEIQSDVAKLVPGGAPRQVADLTTSALNRLSTKGGQVKSHRKENSFHLAFSESSRVKEQTADYLLGEESLIRDLTAALYDLDPTLDASPEKSAEEAKNLKNGLERVLMKRGEAFAAAVNEGESFQLDATQISEDLVAHSYRGLLHPNDAANAILRMFDGPSEETRNHLRRLIDAYTLFAFLKLTPDVQRTMARVFSEGDIWLDTSAILPLLGELLVTDPAERHYTNLFDAARSAGLNLYVTDGVVEEITSHLHRCANVASKAVSDLQNSLPFVYATYILSGRNPAEFTSWLEDIRGTSRPEDDVRAYLQFHFGIVRRSLAELADNASIELRGAVQELWNAAHDKRRGDNVIDPGSVSRLVAHDVENTVGVIEARKQSSDSPMGYRAWWLTLDKTAMRLRQHLRDHLGDKAPDSPALSPDFLSLLLRLGPLRTGVEATSLPLATHIARFESVPKELLALAQEIRAKHAGMSEFRIQREVRDALDAVRGHMGPEAQGGSKLMEERIRRQLQQQ